MTQDAMMVEIGSVLVAESGPERWVERRGGCFSNKCFSPSTTLRVTYTFSNKLFLFVILYQKVIPDNTAGIEGCGDEKNVGVGKIHFAQEFENA